MEFPLSPSALKFDSFQSVLWLSHSLLLQTYQTACARFTPNKSGQRSGPTYYRGCWHVVSRPFLVRYRQVRNFPLFSQFFSYNRALRSEKPSSLTRRCSVRVAPIAEDSLLLPPVGVWAVSQSQCGRSPSQVGYVSKPW